LQLFHVIKSFRQEQRLSLEVEGNIQLLVSRQDVLQNCTTTKGSILTLGGVMRLELKMLLVLWNCCSLYAWFQN